MQFRIAMQAEAGLFADLERSAGLLFRVDPELAWLADADGLSAERYREIIADGWSWVAESDPGHPMAFAAATREGEELHIWEFDVRIDCQRRGIGRTLLQRFIAEAAAAKIRAVTLTTFRDLPWNAPFYQSVGFDVVAPDRLDPRLAAVLADETAKGLPAARRCAMRMKIQF